MCELSIRNFIEQLVCFLCNATPTPCISNVDSTFQQPISTKQPLIPIFVHGDTFDLCIVWKKKRWYNTGAKIHIRIGESLHHHYAAMFSTSTYSTPIPRPPRNPTELTHFATEPTRITFYRPSNPLGVRFFEQGLKLITMLIELKKGPNRYI